MGKIKAVVVMLFMGIVFFSPAPMNSQQPKSQDDQVLSKMPEADRLKIENLQKSIENIQLKGLILQNKYKSDLSDLQNSYNEIVSKLNIAANEALKTNKLEGKYKWDDNSSTFVSVQPSPKTSDNKK